MKAKPVEEYVLTSHARFEMLRRRVDEELVRLVLTRPEQRFQVRPGRDVLQSRVENKREGRTYLIRVFVDIDRHPAEVVTAYRTSKIEKYWSE